MNYQLRTIRVIYLLLFLPMWQAFKLHCWLITQSWATKQSWSGKKHNYAFLSGWREQFFHKSFVFWPCTGRKWTWATKRDLTGSPSNFWCVPILERRCLRMSLRQVGIWSTICMWQRCLNVFFARRLKSTVKTWIRRRWWTCPSSKHPLQQQRDHILRNAIFWQLPNVATWL